MKIGAVYRNLGQTLIPLTEKNLDGYVLFLRIQLHIGQWVDNQPIFDEYTKINNTQKANDDQKKRDAVQFVFYKVDDAFEKKTLDSTYRESSEIELGVGDRFIEAGKQDEYTVLGFYMREVQKDVTSIKSPMVERRFPYAVNLKPIISFVDVVAKSRDGINKLSLNGLPSFSAFGTEHALNDSDQYTLTQLFYSNTKLAYWSVDATRVSSIVYMKQSKPEPKVNITVDFNAPRKTLRPKQYAEYREFLGEEYTDEFIELIDQLDWGRIAELSKDIPEIKNVVKEIVSQVYVDFLIERRLLKASEPNLFEWLVAPWEQMSDEAYGIWAKYNDAKKDGKIQTAAFTATVDDLQANKRERKKFGIIALRDVGSYGTNDKLLKIANGLERLVISNDTSKNLIEDYEQYVNAIKELNDGETKSFTIPLEDGGFDKAIKILSSQTSNPLPTTAAPINHFEYLIHPWRGMMSPEELKKYKTAEGWGENADIFYATFECDYKNLGRRQYTMLLFMDMGDSARWKEKLRELKKLEGVVDVEYLGDTYPAIQEAVYGNAPQGYMSAEVVIVNQADYPKASEIIIELPKPSATPTKYFEWHKEPWERLLSNAVLEKFVKLNKWNQDAETYEASFTCDYKDKGRKTFTIWLFVNVGSSLAWKEKRGKLEAIEEKIDRSWIMNTYPAIHENIDKMLMASTNYVSSFIISQDDLADANEILFDFSKAQATQPEPTTNKPATKQFEWLTKPWDELLGQVRIQQLVETQGWKKEAKALFASFSCDYKGKGSQYFGLAVIQHAGEGKKWAKMRDKIVQVEAKIDPVWILTNYPETAKAISKLEKTIGSRNQDFFVFRHADLKTVMEILTGIKEQTKEPEPKPVSKREPKAKVSKPTEKDELDELLDLDFDDI